MRAVATILVVLLSGCVSIEEYSSDNFSKELSRAGFNVVVGDPIDQPFMEARGRLLSINGNNIAQVFDYSSEGEAERIGNSVSSDGAVIGKSSVLWKTPPRFYRKSGVIVIYTGKDEAVAKGIEAIIGKPFVNAYTSEGEAVPSSTNGTSE